MAARFLAVVLLPVAQAAVLVGAKAQYTQKIPGNNDGHYTDEDYLIRRVGAAAAAGLVIAVICFLCFFCFCCIQCCAKCGCKCVKSMCPCCGARDADPAGYSRKQRLLLVFTLLLAWACIVAGSGLGYTGNADVQTGLDEFSVAALALADEVNDQAKMGYDASVAVSTKTVSNQMVLDAEKLQNMIKDKVELISDSEDARYLGACVFYGVVVAVPLLGFFSWICGVATLSYLMSQIAFCMLILAWILFAATFAAGTLLDDTCVEAGNLVYGDPSQLDRTIECGETESALSTYNDVWQSLDTAQGLLDNKTGAVPSVQETDYGFTTNNGSSQNAGVENSAVYSRNRNLLYGMYDEYGVLTSTCPSMLSATDTALCYVPGINSTTINASYSDQCMEGGSEPDSTRCHKQTQILSAAGMVGTSYLISCNYLDTLALDLNNNVCEPLVDGLVDVCVGQGFIGVFYFLVLAVGCAGMNRFNDENWKYRNTAKVEPVDDEEGAIQAKEENLDPKSEEGAIQAKEENLDPKCGL